MPRRVRTRATRGPDAIDPAIAAYLLDGDLRSAVGSLRERGRPVLILWRNVALKPLWEAHSDELMAEAKRRGIARPWGVRQLDTWPPEAY